MFNIRKVITTCRVSTLPRKQTFVFLTLKLWACIIRNETATSYNPNQTVAAILYRELEFYRELELVLIQNTISPDISALPVLLLGHLLLDFQHHL